MHATFPLLAKTDFPRLRRKQLETLQVNLGYKCNQTCLHCHVNAGPNRTEMMDGDTVDMVLTVLERRKVNGATPIGQWRANHPAAAGSASARARTRWRVRPALA